MIEEYHEAIPRNKNHAGGVYTIHFGSTAARWLGESEKFVDEVLSCRSKGSVELQIHKSVVGLLNLISQQGDHCLRGYSRESKEAQLESVVLSIMERNLRRVRLNDKFGMTLKIDVLIQWLVEIGEEFEGRRVFYRVPKPEEAAITVSREVPTYDGAWS